MSDKVDSWGVEKHTTSPRSEQKLQNKKKKRASLCSPRRHSKTLQAIGKRSGFKQARGSTSTFDLGSKLDLGDAQSMGRMDKRQALKKQLLP